MIRVETYQGTAEELSNFVGQVWSTSYAGKMVFPRWTAEYFRWQFRMDDPLGRKALLAAYEGNDLAGVLLGTSYTFRTSTGIYPGAQWSWLSIHHDHRGKGIAKALDQERMHRSQDQNAPLAVSFRFVGSPHSQAERPHTNDSHKQFHSKIGNWVRVLDASRFDRWTYSRLEALAVRCTVPLAPRVTGLSPERGVRKYQSDDLDACLALIRQSQTGASIWIDWTREQLGHHLAGSPITHTLVLEEDSQIVGLINFHVLPFQGQTIENMGIIDLIACRKASLSGQTRLLRAALNWMAEDQVVVALKPRLGETPLWPLVRLGFAPQPNSSYLVFQCAGNPLPPLPSGTSHLLWR